jgi:hypothetical protein
MVHVHIVALMVLFLTYQCSRLVRWSSSFGHPLSLLRHFVVFPSPSKKITEQNFDVAMGTSLQTFSDLLLISH